MSADWAALLVLAANAAVLWWAVRIEDTLPRRDPGPPRPDRDAGS